MNRLLLLCALCAACASDDNDGFTVTVDGDRLTGELAIDDARLGFEGRPDAIRFFDDRGAPLAIVLDGARAPEGWMPDREVTDDRRAARLASRELMPALADRLDELALGDQAVARVRDAVAETARGDSADPLDAFTSTSVMVGLGKVCAGTEYGEVGMYHAGSHGASFGFAWYTGGSSPSVYTSSSASTYPWSGIARHTITKVKITSSHWYDSWIDYIYNPCI